MLLGFLDALGEVLLPSACLVCHRPIRGQQLCGRCRPPIPRYGARCVGCWPPALVLDEGGQCAPCRTFPLPVRRMRFLWSYGGEARNLITVMKYQPSHVLARTAGGVLGANLASLYPGEEWDLVVPMPASQASLRARGFNQCAILAARLPGLTGRTRYSHRALLHRGVRVPQASLAHDLRLRNVRRAFSGEPGLVAGCTCLLVDDVVTTGATAAAAATALLEAGALAVDLLALARAPVWSEFRARLSTPGR